MDEQLVAGLRQVAVALQERGDRLHQLLVGLVVVLDQALQGLAEELVGVLALGELQQHAVDAELGEEGDRAGAVGAAADLEGVLGLLVALGHAHQVAVELADADAHAPVVAGGRHLLVNGLGQLADLVLRGLAFLDRVEDRRALGLVDHHGLAERQQRVQDADEAVDVLGQALLVLHLVELDVDDPVAAGEGVAEVGGAAAQRLGHRGGVGEQQVAEEVALQLLLVLGDALLLQELDGDRRAAVLDDQAIGIREVALLEQGEVTVHLATDDDGGDQAGRGVRGGGDADRLAVFPQGLEGAVFLPALDGGDGGALVGDELVEEGLGAGAGLREGQQVELLVLDEDGLVQLAGQELGDGLEAVAVEHHLHEPALDVEALADGHVAGFFDRLLQGANHIDHRADVGHHQEREAGALGGLDSGVGNHLEVGARQHHQAGRLGLRQRADPVDPAVGVVAEHVAGGQDQLTALEPVDGVGHLQGNDAGDDLGHARLAGQQRGLRQDVARQGLLEADAAMRRDVGLDRRRVLRHHQAVIHVVPSIEWALGGCGQLWGRSRVARRAVGAFSTSCTM
ncbi:hypothetical protein D3C72_534000 [compost metagenome]